MEGEDPTRELEDESLMMRLRSSTVADLHSKSNTCVYFHRDQQGTEFKSTFSGQEQVKKNPKDGKSDITSGNVSIQNNLDSQVEGDKKDSNVLSLEHQQYGYGNGTTLKSPEIINEIESEDVDHIDESGLELEVTEVDVERVLEKQNTHDLYCPNCNSCITTRVILRKRKRRRDVKRNKLETAVSGLATNNQIRNVTKIHLDATSESAGNDYGHERDPDPDIFRCLSCFSFFIPTGNGFKLFRIFGDKGEAKAVQDQQKSTSKSWISSIFASDEGRILEPGSEIKPDAVKMHTGSRLYSSNVNGQSFSKHQDLSSIGEVERLVKSGIVESREDGDEISTSSINVQFINPTETLDAGDNSNKAIKVNTDTGYTAKDQFEVITGSQPSTTNVPMDFLACHQSNTVKASTNRIPVINRKSPEHAVSVSPPDELKLLISSHGGSPTPEKLGTVENPDLAIQDTGAGGHNINENSQQTINDIKKEIHAEELLKPIKDPLVLSVKDISFVQGRPANLIKDRRKVTAELPEGKDTVIVVESETVYGATSQILQDLNVSEETGALTSLASLLSVTEPRETNAREVYQIEIVKSIVYGGLIESVTSTGLVSSAAGSNTATLNILALALANLIGGLVLIGHNLWELKKDKVIEGVDRYKQVLGERENFLVHATVVTLSFLTFGLIPPMTYGLSFGKSENRELKNVAVAVASVASAIVLATGKAYVRKPPKSYLKTIAYYVVMGLMVSGVSYAVGELIIKRLRFHSNSHPQMTPALVQWA